MTVTLLKPYAAYAQGASVDLDNATEASLVAQTLATYTTNPGSSYYPLTAVEVQALRDGGGSTLTSAQAVAVASLWANITVGSQSAASANVTAINAASLAAQQSGTFSKLIFPAGVTYINALLTVRRNVEFEVSGAAQIVCVVPGGTTAFNVFQNEGFNNAPVAITSVTGVQLSTPPNQVRLTWTFAAAHGLAAGDPFLVTGDASEYWNHGYIVEAVSSPTVVTVQMGAPNPGGSLVFPALSGSPVGVKADPGIKLTIRGTINANYRNGGFTQASNYNDHVICLNNVYRPQIDGYGGRILDARKYGVCMARAFFPITGGLDFDTSSDGVHTYGPSWGPVVEDITGHTGDDTCIFQTIEPTTYVAYMPPNAGGTIYQGGAMRRIKPHWSGNAGICMLYPNGGTSTDLGYRMKGTYVIEDVGGGMIGGNASFFGSQPVGIGNGYTTVAGGIEKLVMRNIDCRNGAPNLDNTAGAAVITIDTLEIDGLAFDSANAANLTVSVNYLTIDQFILKRVSGTTNGNLINWKANAICNRFSGHDVAPILGGNFTALMVFATGAVVGTISWDGNSGPRTSQTGCGWYIINGGTIRSAKHVNCYSESPYISSSAGAFTPTNTPSFHYSNCSYNFNGAAFAIGGTVAAKIRVANFKHENSGGSAKLVNFFGTGVIDFEVTGYEIAGGGPATATVAANLQSAVTWRNPDGSAPIDLTLVARTGNSFAAHTADSNNLYLCDFTGGAGSWKKMTAPATTI